MSEYREEEYTASEQLLLRQFKALDDIKKGKRALKRTAAEEQQLSKPATATKAPEKQGVTVSASGLKQPSKIRLKQTKPQSAPLGLQPIPAGSITPAAAAAAAAVAPGAAAAATADQPTALAGPAEAAQQLQHAVEPEPAAAATISKQALLAALGQKLAERQQQQHAPKPAAASAAADEAASAAPTAAAAPAVRNFREAHKARQQLPAAPQTPTGSAAAGPMSIEPQQEQKPAAAAAARAPPAAAAAKALEVDYGAVSSPEYDVDYDAVSSPSYDGVSRAATDQQQHKQHQAQHLPMGSAPSQAPSTPDHTHSGMPPADTHRTTSPAAAKHLGNNLHRPSARRPDAGGARSRSRSRSRYSRGNRSRSRSRYSRGNRSRSRSRLCSRSPDAGRDRRRRISSSRSPDWRAREGSQHSMRRSSSRRHSRSRSPSPDHHRQRSWPRSGSRGYRRSHSARSRSRSPSRSRSRRYEGRARRASPDYGIGPGGVSVPVRSHSPAPDPAAAGTEEGELELQPGEDVADGSDDGQAAAPRGSRQHKQQQHQQQPGCTLFVGDLPAAGFTSTDLQGLFGAFGWNVVSARVMGSQCYGFVEFGTELEAEQALQLVQDKDPGFNINGCFIRASRAKGSMPRWKQGKAVLSKRDRGQGLEGLEAYEHPTARMVRLQAAAALAAASQGSKGLDAVPSALPVAVLPGQLICPGVLTAPQGRPVIDYGDL